MPFLFSDVCALLSSLEKLRTRDPPLLPKDLQGRSKKVVEIWFRTHRQIIDAPETDRAALLSTLFPEKRGDRVYNLQAARLSRLLARALGLNSLKTKALMGWRIAGNGDLGECAARVQEEFDCEPKPGMPVTVEQIDQALNRIASRVPFSSSAIRAIASPLDTASILQGLLPRMKSREIKWIVRLLMKDFSPVVIEEYTVQYNVHFLLPDLLRFQQDFAAVDYLLRTQFRYYHADPDFRSQKTFRVQAAKLLRPKLGVRVGRPPFWKARSLDHCIKMAASRCPLWSVERKYDGEYCEIHVDLSQGQDCIRVFSKSGKDSTSDRRNVHSAIKNSLRIGKINCSFTKCCIVLSELVVFSDKEQRIQEFHKIRKYVDRSGRRIGVKKDSPRRDCEHLMLVFFDVLMIDDDMTINKPYLQRREALTKLVKKIPGHSITSERICIDFSSDSARAQLRKHFAAALAERAEGLVLKPANLPYFSLASEDEDPLSTVFIKLKRDYIQVLGIENDVVDLTVVGASYDAQMASRIDIRGLHFTAFHLGCLINPEAVRFGTMPVFQVVGRIVAEQCIPKPALQALNEYMKFHSQSFERVDFSLRQPKEYDLVLDRTSNSKMDVLVTIPCVVEVLGADYVKPADQAFYMLRHPRILRLHLDRTWKDADTLADLQAKAYRARNASAEGETQEEMRLFEQLVSRHELLADKEASRRTLSTPARTASTLSPRSVRRRLANEGRDVASRSLSTRLSKPPVFVRVDTAEKEGDTAPAVLEVDAGVLQPRKDGSNSLPTPPISSPNLEMCPRPSPPPAAGSPDSPGDLSKGLTVEAGKKKRGSWACLSSQQDKRRKTDSSALQSGQITSSKELIRRLSCPSEPFSNHLMSPVNPLKGDAHPGSCRVQRNGVSYNCPLENAVVVLTPCVHAIPLLVQDLSPVHGATVITDLGELIREDEVPTSQRELIVPESQAYPGKTRIVLVERRRCQQNHNFLKDLLGQKFKQPLWFFDQRLVEGLYDYELNLENQGSEGFAQLALLLSAHFLGRAVPNDEGKGMKWMDGRCLSDQECCELFREMTDVRK